MTDAGCRRVTRRACCYSGEHRQGDDILYPSIRYYLVYLSFETKIPLRILIRNVYDLDDDMGQIPIPIWSRYAKIISKLLRISVQQSSVRAFYNIFYSAQLERVHRRLRYPCNVCLQASKTSNPRKN